MIFGLILLGLLLMDTAIKGTQHELGQQLQSDLIGANGFIVWIFAILAIGAIGYIPGLKTASNYLLALLLTVVVIRNGGVFQQFQAALQQASQGGPAPSIAPKPTSLDSSGSSSGGSSSSSSSDGSDSTASTVSTIATIAEVAAVLA